MLAPGILSRHSEHRNALEGYGAPALAHQREDVQDGVIREVGEDHLPDVAVKHRERRRGIVRHLEGGTAGRQRASCKFVIIRKLRQNHILP